MHILFRNTHSLPLLSLYLSISITLYIIYNTSFMMFRTCAHGHEADVLVGTRLKEQGTRLDADTSTASCAK